MIFPFALLFISIFMLLRSTNAHVAAWHKGMYCLNGTSGEDDPSTNDAVNPLYNLTTSDWWMHHINGCDQFPPAPGDYLELPANGQFTVQLAVNRAFTSLSFNGQYMSRFGDGQAHPGLGQTPLGQEPSCITEPNIHTQNQSMAAGTAFAISYTSDITKVTPQNLVIFTVLYNTPWMLNATYSVPNLPACPDQGCICAWGWVPNGCGTPNMYMLPYKCKVTGVTGNAAVAPGTPAVWCENDPSKCVVGAKQMIYWHQADGNNIQVDGVDLAGEPKSPAYNKKLGFSNGAQRDIFLKLGSATQTSVAGASTQTSPVSSATSKPHKPHSSSSRLSIKWPLLALISILNVVDFQTSLGLWDMFC